MQCDSSTVLICAIIFVLLVIAILFLARRGLHSVDKQLLETYNLMRQSAAQLSGANVDTLKILNVSRASQIKQVYCVLGGMETAHKLKSAGVKANNGSLLAMGECLGHIGYLIDKYHI